MKKLPKLNCPHILVWVAVMLVATGFTSTAYGQATSITSTGYRANEGGNGALSLEYTTDDLGNTWSEGQ